MDNKEIKKLRKAHVWPAVTFLIFYVLLSAAACAFFSFAVLSYFASDRMNAVYENVKNIGSLFPEGSDASEYERVLRYLETDTEYSDAIYLLDRNNNIIAGYGGATYDLDKDFDVAFLVEEEGCCLCLDSESESYILDDAGNVDFRKISKELPQKNIESLRDLRKKEVLFKDHFWVCVPVAADQKLLVKTALVIYTTDVMIPLMVAVAAFSIMFLPLLFLFGNVIVGVLNQRHMTQVLYIDVVTGGKNWMYYEDTAKKILCSLGNAAKGYAVVDIALMKYRNFCTFHGIEAGEALLAKTDKYLTGSLAKRKELCAHNGRASFALLLQCADLEEGRRRVERMLAEMTDLHGHIGTAYHAGIYFVEPAKGGDGRKAVRRKDINLGEWYNHASAARMSIPEDNPMETAVFDQAMLEEKLWEHKVEEKMQQALDREEFIVYLQPKYNPLTEQLAGAEALVRWINEEDGFISPGKFIPIFEKNGFITKLDDYMISHVAKLQSQWLAEGKNVVPVSVNVSRAHFANANLAEHICSLVDAYQTPHHLIEIELTESAFFDDKAALLSTVRKLQDAGFDVSMDDFGAGYSSLNSLKDLPLNVLKLDADFFRGEDGEARGEIVVAEAISLAKKLNMRIVAEGIEKKEQVDFLARQNCDMIQGFYFAKPMPADEYQERLQAHE